LQRRKGRFSEERTRAYTLDYFEVQKGMIARKGGERDCLKLFFAILIDFSIVRTFSLEINNLGLLYVFLLRCIAKLCFISEFIFKVIGRRK
jgi:hypothetical protein